MSKSYWNSETKSLMSSEQMKAWINNDAERGYERYLSHRRRTLLTFSEYCDRALFPYETEYGELVKRFEQTKAMHTIVRNLNDENAYMRWIELVPDEATEEDLVDIADDDELFDEACGLFTRLVARYGKDGYVVGTNGTRAWGRGKTE